VQAEYANKLLFIATLAFAKLSIISLLMILTESDLHRRLATAQTVVIALWGIVSEFVAAFQCGIKEPLRFIGPESHCLNLVRCFLLAMSLTSANLHRHLSGSVWALSIF
jgi:hypothetical protein